MALQTSMSAPQQLETAIEEVFSVRSMLRRYKHDSWSNQLVVRQSPASKNMSTEAEDICGICQQAMTGVDIAN
jgi:hypothetical protein